MIVGGFQYINLGTVTLHNDLFGWFTCIIPRDTALKFATDKTVILQSVNIKVPDMSLDLNIRNLVVNSMFYTDRFLGNTDTYYFTTTIPNVIGSKDVVDAIIAVTIPKIDENCLLQLYCL